MVKLTRKKFAPKSFIGLATAVYHLKMYFNEARPFSVVGKQCTIFKWSSLKEISTPQKFTELATGVYPLKIYFNKARPFQCAENKVCNI